MALIQCPECGATVSDQATSCPQCGSPLNQGTPVNQQPPVNYPQAAAPIQPAYQAANPQDTPNAGLNVLSFFFPLIGWILYFVFKGETPKKAKSCSKFAWIGFGVSFLLSFIVGIIGALAY